MSIYGQIGPMVSERRHAIDTASAHADVTGTPCGVWERDGWAVASEIAPDSDDPADTREADGWELVAVLDHMSVVLAMQDAGC